MRIKIRIKLNKRQGIPGDSLAISGIHFVLLGGCEEERKRERKREKERER